MADASDSNATHAQAGQQPDAYGGPSAAAGRTESVLPAQQGVAVREVARGHNAFDAVDDATVDTNRRKQHEDEEAECGRPEVAHARLTPATA